MHKIGLGDNFLEMTPKAQATMTKKKIGQTDYILTSNFSSSKNATEWEKIFQNHVSDKGSISRIYFLKYPTTQQNNKT